MSRAGMKRGSFFSAMRLPPVHHHPRTPKPDLMMRTRFVVFGLAVVALSGTRLSAQTCVGSASFSAGPVSVGAGLGTSEGVKSYGVSLAAGVNSGLYAGGSLSRIEYADLDGSSSSVAVGAGYAINLNRSRTVQFCPEVAYQHVSGPDIDYAGQKITTSARAFSYGGALGTTVPVLPSLDFVPFTAAYYVTTRATATLATDSESETQNYGEFDVGAGFVIIKALTLQPSVAIPFGISGGKSTFDIGFAFNFGKR
jgi:hypothetical protein